MIDFLAWILIGVQVLINLSQWYRIRNLEWILQEHGWMKKEPEGYD